MDLVGDDDITVYEFCQTLYMQQLSRGELGRLVGELGNGGFHHDHRITTQRKHSVDHFVPRKR